MSDGSRHELLVPIDEPVEREMLRVDLPVLQSCACQRTDGERTSLKLL